MVDAKLLEAKEYQTQSLNDEDGSNVTFRPFNTFQPC